MAETLVSPGVLARENDQTFIQGLPVTRGAALIGPAVKGPVEVPTVVSSYGEYQRTFGTTLTSGSGVYTYLTSISAYNYFQNGGNNLTVARVVNDVDDWTHATSSLVSSNAPAASGSAFTLESLGKGTIYNTGTSVLTDSSQALTSGSRDNFRYEIVNPNTGSGTFDLLIRRGNDQQNQKVVLETFTGLSLDPLQDNYIAKVIGDQSLSYNSTDNQLDYSGTYPNRSNYVRVSAVNFKMPNYLDNTGGIGTGSYKEGEHNDAFIPTAQSGTFGDGVGSNPGYGGKTGSFYDNIGAETQGVDSDDYTNMLTLLSDPDQYQFNLITVPGINDEDHSSTVSTLINNTQTRGDSIAVIDPENYDGTLADAVAEANSRNSSYAAMYWPWCQVLDPDQGDAVWVPASTLIPGVYAQNDSQAAEWFAPAGLNRGGLNQVIRASKKLSQSNRDELYQANINPIATFPNTGVVVFGQKTLQKRASALDRVNVRRLLIELKDYISQVADQLVFEQNTIATRNNFLAQVNPYLESVQQRQGLYAFKVVMDDSNNTADVIDRNQLIGQIFVQPTRTAEFVILDFNVLPTGATFPS
jgi:uncharacterized protein